MTEITLDITKNIEKNAEVYFNKSKRAKKKLAKTIKAIERLKKKKKVIDEKQQIEQQEQEQKLKIEQREKLWYEKFHWFISSEGFLVVGGRDATSNEIVIKKHTNPKDIVFHTDAPGSPFFVIQTKGKKPKSITLKETAIATASYSKAWKLGLTTLDVFCVNPDQVTKETQAGEYMPKGAFMVYGKKKYFRPIIDLAIGIKDDRVMAAPLTAIKKHCKKYVEIQTGKAKKSELAKKIRKLIGGTIDEIVAVIPSGGSEIKK